jgi:hypothetical protein
MFAEDVILSALQEHQFWFVGDYLLEHEGRGVAESLARQIADRNELRLERVDEDDRHGYRFWRVE